MINKIFNKAEIPKMYKIIRKLFFKNAKQFNQ